MWNISESCLLKYWYNYRSRMPFCTGICTPACSLPFLLLIHTADAGVEKLSPSSTSGTLSRLSPFLLAFFSLLFISALPHAPSFLLVSLSHFLLSSLSTHWWFIKAYSPLMISYGVVVWKATWVFLTPFRKSSTLKFSQGKHLTKMKWVLWVLHFYSKPLGYHFRKLRTSRSPHLLKTP